MGEMARVAYAAPLAGGAGNGGAASLLGGAAEVACLCGALALAWVDFWTRHLVFALSARDSLPLYAQIGAVAGWGLSDLAWI